VEIPEQEQRDRQLRLSPEPALDSHRDHRAEGPSNEREREDREGEERAFEAILEGEEHRREDQDRRDPVDEEVEVL
jgi:hypothetical protein